MTKKQVVRCISFALILFAMMIALCDLFEQENSTQYDQRYNTYKTMDKGVADAVFIGTSGVDRYWIGAKAYEEYGISMYPFSVEEMPSFLTVNMLEDALKYQDPELILIDLRLFQQNHAADKMDTRARRVLDAMDLFSANRMDAAFKTMKLIHQVDESKSEFDISFLLSFVKYHSKWSEESYRFERNIGSRQNPYGGFYMDSTNTIKAKEIKPKIQKEGLLEDMDPITEDSLYEVLDYIEEKDLNVLFVYTPRLDGPVKTGQRNRIAQILDEEGADYVMFQLSDPTAENYVEFDYKTDFYDDGHVNFYGAEKFTDYFAAYLDDRYDLPDRRNDATVQAFWDGVYDRILAKVAEFEEKAAA